MEEARLGRGRVRDGGRVEGGQGGIELPRLVRVTAGEPRVRRGLVSVSRASEQASEREQDAWALLNFAYNSKGSSLRGSARRPT